MALNTTDQITWHNSGTAMLPFHRSPSDPIGYDRSRDQWFFYDETWCRAHGRYDTEASARTALAAYHAAEV